MKTLGVDTSNYATSLAVYDDGNKEVVCAKKRLLPIRAGALGMRQSEAVFQHTLALPILLDEMRQISGALDNIKAVGVSQKPRPVQGSYMPCFLAGVSFASAFAAALNVPVVQTTHQQGHIVAALFGTRQPALMESPLFMFHLSGGTTDLLLTQGGDVVEILGGSLDLYAGQAIDRLGVALGFDFPAGKSVSDLACKSTKSIPVKPSVKGLSCHFSGLQNQCEQLLKNGEIQADVCAYCLRYIANTCVELALNVRNQHGNLPIVCAGGVMSSSIICREMQSVLDDIYFVPPELSSDNAVGVAILTSKMALV